MNTTMPFEYIFTEDSGIIIQPTIGRVMHYRGGAGEPQRVGIITEVKGIRMVNLAVFSNLGVCYPATSVALRQPGDPEPTGRYCEWLPYQVDEVKEMEMWREAEMSAQRTPEAEPKTFDTKDIDVGRARIFLDEEEDDDPA